MRPTARIDCGLSPPVRGSPYAPSTPPGISRSIPARAGEPAAASFSRIACWVYPRPCGGACLGVIAHRDGSGLSPPVRGSLLRGVERHVEAGSIPARAGEPCRSTLPGTPWRVYPRPCGGASRGRHSLPVSGGLSPPVRGSRRGEPPLAPGERSIPARAGEPSVGSAHSIQYTVYPRPCGGAITSEPPCALRSGLSPPVRGSHAASAPVDPGRGSIPARAGEPPQVRRRREGLTVYPRPCGGASSNGGIARCVTGLSPPVRGSQAVPYPLYLWSGSIPARAGEPRHVSRWLSDHKVYPRPCGGASCDTDTTVASCGGLGQLRTHLYLEGQVLIGWGSLPDEQHPVRVPYLFRRIAQVPQAEAAGDGAVPVNHRYRPVSESVEPA